MFIALVGFGIGGATGGGGIFDALGIGGSNTSSDPQYDQQIDNAQTGAAGGSQGREGAAQARPLQLPRRAGGAGPTTGPDHLERRDADQLPGRDRRLGALPGDEAEEARRRRRRADAQGLHGASPAPIPRRIQQDVIRRSRRRRSSPTRARASAPTSQLATYAYLRRRRRRPVRRRSRRRSRRRPIRPPRNQVKAQVKQARRRARRSRRRSSRALPTRANSRIRSAASAAPSAPASGGG